MGKRVKKESAQKHNLSLGRRIIALTLVLMMLANPMSLGRSAYAVDGDVGQGTLTNVQPTESEPTEGQPTESEPTEGQPTESEPTEGQPTESEPTEAQPTESKPTEAQPTESEPTEGQPTESEPTEGQPTESEPEGPLGPAKVPAKVPANGGLSDDGNTYGDVTIKVPDEDGAPYTVLLTLKRYQAPNKLADAQGFESELNLLVDGQSASATFNPQWDGNYITISDIAAGSEIVIDDIAASGVLMDEWEHGRDVEYTTATVEITSNTGEKVKLKSSTQTLEDSIVFETGVEQNLTEDTFIHREEDYSSEEGEYTLLNLLNNYNVVSRTDIESTHIVGPIIAQYGAYRTSFPFGSPAGTSSEVLAASDYSRGVSSYVGKLYYQLSNPTEPTVKINYGFENADFIVPHFYTRATDIVDGALVGIANVQQHSAIYQQIQLAGAAFFSPNNGGATENYSSSNYKQEELSYTYQNDHFIDFDYLWDVLDGASDRLMTTGRVHGQTDVIVVEDAGEVLEIDAGKSYLIKDASKLYKVNITTPEGYDFFKNPYLVPTTISFEGDTINPVHEDGKYGGKLVSRLPETWINGEIVVTGRGAGEEYAEVGNKIIWNMPNIVTTDDGSNRLVPYSTTSDFAGHLVAVNAGFWCISDKEEWMGYNLNGAAIVDDFHSGEMEMHLWPYGGMEEKDTYVDLEGFKTFKNGDLGAHSFQFALTADANNPADGLVTADAVPFTSTATETGEIYFPTLVFGQTGNYRFYLEEVIPDPAVAGIVYDQSRYQIDIEVTSKDDFDVAGKPIVQLLHTVTYTKIRDAAGETVEEVVRELTFLNEQEVPTEATSYQFTKVNKLGEALEGATFVLTDDLAKWDTPIQTVTSGADGIVSFDDLAPATTYYFKETVAPEGYILADGYWTLTVDDKGVVTVTAVDGAPEIADGELVNENADTTLVSVTLSKQNLFGELLAGATFQIERVVSMDDHTLFSEEDGHYSATVTSDANGDILIQQLPREGVYRVEEISAPDGYLVPTYADYWLIQILPDEGNAENELGYIVKLHCVDKADDDSFTVTEANDFVIVNIQEYTLPSTGGLGTTYYTMIGLLLIGCGALACTKTVKKRMEM